MWQRGSILPTTVLLLLSVTPVAAQVEVTFHGGVHMGAPTGPRNSRDQVARPAAGYSTLVGEATTAGARLGVGISDRWSLDGGIAWSRSSSWEGTVGRTVPSFEARTLFLSSTVQGWLTEPGARFGVVAGMGPAVILQRGNGTSLTRQTNLGGMLTVGGVMRLDRRFSLRLDAQQYLFSNSFVESYTPHLGTAPVRESTSRPRHDFVLLAGFSWRSD